VEEETTDVAVSWREWVGYDRKDEPVACAAGGKLSVAPAERVWARLFGWA
jgi:hypothetical protein